MKTRERIHRLRESKSWIERLALAKDHLPGTRFDAFIPRMLEALQSVEDHPRKHGGYLNADGTVDLARLATDTLAAIGADFANAFKAGDSAFFREWADAADAWHQHEAQPDKLRAALVRLCVPPAGPHAMRDVLRRLPAKGVRITENTPRQVRHLAPQLKITIKGTPGAPRKNRDAKAGKSRR